LFHRQKRVFRSERFSLVYYHTPVNLAEVFCQLIAGEVPVQRLITAWLPMSELTTALQRVADRTTLRPILLPDRS
jgi:hypothetical protein